jgi:hypothetical protein
LLGAFAVQSIQQQCPIDLVATERSVRGDIGLFARSMQQALAAHRHRQPDGVREALLGTVRANEETVGTGRLGAGVVFDRAPRCARWC